MKAIGNSVAAVVAALLLVAAIAPILIKLSHALVPVLVVVIVGAAGLRVLWFHTRRF